MSADIADSCPRKKSVTVSVTGFGVEMMNEPRSQDGGEFVVDVRSDEPMSEDDG